VHCIMVRSPEKKGGGSSQILVRSRGAVGK
jgi:hypothetical protein